MDGKEQCYKRQKLTEPSNSEEISKGPGSFDCTLEANKLNKMPSDSFSEKKKKRTNASRNSIIIIGMDGSGKNTLGKYVAQTLGYQFFNLDHVLETEIGTTIKQSVRKSGWENFRNKELEVFKKVVCANDNIKKVISCGCGIIETPEAFQILKSFPYVVQIHRHIDDISADLNQDSEQPASNIMEVWEKRKHLYRNAASFEFPSLKGCKNIDARKEQFLRFIKTIIGITTFKMGNGSFFFAITSGDVNEIIPIIHEVSQGVDALELRVDHLNNHSVEFIREQIAILRHKTHLPLIFTVRSSGQGGKFPDNENEIFDVLKLGIRLGCEFIDMESHWSIESRSQLLDNKKHSQIVASHHVRSGTPKNQELESLFHRVNHNGRADIVKVVTTANEQHDAIRLMHVASSIKLVGNPPIILLAMADKGKITRVCNNFLTPVAHPLCTIAAAPGMLSVLDIQNVRKTIGMLNPKSFFICGSPVTNSLSPLMHNTGFEWCYLPYKYSKLETTDPNVVGDMIKKEDFGGCSVTMPLKEKLFDFVDEVSEAVQTIGALNTITKTDEGRLLGDNTDWCGIADSFHDYISDLEDNDCAIIIGEGVTARTACYALKQIGFTNDRIVIHNPQTPSKATAFAKKNDCKAVNPFDQGTLSKLLGNYTIRIIICTLPPTAEWVIPLALIDKISPIIFDTTYMHTEGTLLTKQAKEQKWKLIRGIDMFIAQGLRQFDIWSLGRSRSVNPIINSAVRSAYENKTL